MLFEIRGFYITMDEILLCMFSEETVRVTLGLGNKSLFKVPTGSMAPLEEETIVREVQVQIPAGPPLRDLTLHWIFRVKKRC